MAILEAGVSDVAGREAERARDPGDGVERRQAALFDPEKEMRPFAAGSVGRDLLDGERVGRGGEGQHGGRECQLYLAGSIGAGRVGGAPAAREFPSSIARYIRAEALVGFGLEHRPPLRRGVLVTAGGVVAEPEVDAPWRVARLLGAHQLELADGGRQLAHLAQRLAELGADVGERRAERQRPLVLADRLVEDPDRAVGGAQLGVHVGDLAFDEGIELARGALDGRHRLLVDRPGLAVLAEVVAGDHQVQRRLGVRRVEAQRGAEHLLRFDQPPLVVVDDPQHVVDVRVGRLAAQDLGQAGDRLGVLARGVVGAPARDQRAHVAGVGRLSHGPAAGASAVGLGCGFGPKRRAMYSR